MAKGVTTIAVKGRPNQKSRTRKDLLQAASRLMKEGRRPNLEEVAAAALVSRATAYRYFPSIEALLAEAQLDVATPDTDEVLRDAPAHDPVARLERVDAALQAMMQGNEAQLRLMLANSLQRSVERDPNSDVPIRQNRRTPLIEAALAPARQEFAAADYKLLARALALVMGTEGMLVFKDVLELDETQARKVRHWVIRSLVAAARK